MTLPTPSPTRKRPAGQRPRLPAPVLSLLLVLLTVATAVTACAGAQSPVPVGQAAPDFTLRSADGDEVSLTQAMAGRRGAVVVFYRGFF